MKKIGLDVRMIGLKHAGIGRYVQNLARGLKKSNAFEFVFIKNRIPHYSLKEQVLMPWIIWFSRVNLAHFPHFNVPILCPTPFVVTIHDLIKHRSKGLDTTTRFPFLYWFKFFVYLLVFRLAVKRAKKIIVPSKAVKEELIERYRLNPQKVVVIYEGVDDKFKTKDQRPKTKDQFLIYTGSLYPHKNVERLIKAIKGLKIKLVICCSRDVFWQRMKKKIKEMKAEKFVKLLGFVPDEELVSLYQRAAVFVQPSLMEGFDLTVIEAMASGLPVICSDIPVHREICGKAAVYFNPYDVRDMAEKIKLILQSPKLRGNLRQKGLRQAGQYSWQKMTRKTIEIYQEALL
jgi:glycosyltransferase involved in cell wall biosynthesis